MTNQDKSNNLNCLVDPTLTILNRLFVLSFDNEDVGRSSFKYYTPTIEIADFNILIYGKSLVFHKIL